MPQRKSCHACCSVHVLSSQDWLLPGRLRTWARCSPAIPSCTARPCRLTAKNRISECPRAAILGKRAAAVRLSSPAEKSSYLKIGSSLEERILTLKLTLLTCFLYLNRDNFQDVAVIQRSLKFFKLLVVLLHQSTHVLGEEEMAVLLGRLFSLKR